MLSAIALRSDRILFGSADFLSFLTVCFFQKVLDLVLFQQLALLVEDLRKGWVLRLDVNACVQSS